jgi:hypothetical protein
MSASSQPVWDMDLQSRGTAPITVDEAIMVIEERMKVRSRGNPKERIPGKAPIQLNKQSCGTTPSARSLTPFAFQYIFLS